MRKVELTDKNIRSVAASLRKILSSTFFTYYDFDCGYKKIVPHQDLKFRDPVESVEVIGEELTVCFNTGSKRTFSCGDVACFLGNSEVVIQSPHKGPEGNFIYYVFRSGVLTDEIKSQLDHARKEKAIEDSEKYYNPGLFM